MSGKRHSKESKQKIRERLLGEGNPQYGRYWITNVETKEKKRIDKDKSIPEGWVRGKTGKTPKTCWVNNGVHETIIPISSLSEYIKRGFIRKRLTPPFTMRR